MSHNSQDSVQSATRLDPSESWDAVRQHAEQSLARGGEHFSPNHDRRYEILEVQRAKIVVERIGRDGQPQRKPLTRNTVMKMIEILNKHPAGCERSTLHETYYVSNMLVDLHPRLTLQGSTVVVLPEPVAADFATAKSESGEEPHSPIEVSPQDSPVSEAPETLRHSPSPGVWMSPPSAGDQPTRAISREETPVQPFDARSAGGMPTRAQSPDARRDRISGKQINDGELPAKVSDRYELLSALRPGGMGQVWKVRDRSLNRTVALKQIRNSLAQDQRALDRFFVEARAIAALNHPNVVHVYELDEQVPCFIMEYVEGGDLATWLEENGPLAVETATRLTIELADALQVAHRHSEKILHRDIKPANILMARGRQNSIIPKLCDFGLARIESMETHTQTGTVIGTLDYMAPEQQRDARQTSELSDQWSLAATMYAMLTGTSPRFMRESRIPESVRDVLVQALEEQPADRFADMGEFSAQLEACLEQLSPSPKTVTDDGLSQLVPEADTESKNGSGIGDAVRAMQQRIDAVHQEARRLFQDEHDCPGALRLLREIPEHLRDAALCTEIETQQTRKDELERLIEESIQTDQLDGLRQPAEELLALQPDRQDLQNLLQTLPIKVICPSCNKRLKLKDAKQLDRKCRCPACDCAFRPSDGFVFETVSTSEVIQKQRAVLKSSQSAARPPMLVAPFDAAEARRGQEEWAAFLGKPVEWENSIGMKFRLVPPGEFVMGSPETEAERCEDEKQHKVRITRPFYCGMFPVTQAEYEHVMGSNPSSFSATGTSALIVSGLDTSRFPVEQVSWEDAQQFLAKLMQQSDESGRKYRLLTEAEWEYSCRAGTQTPFWFGSKLNGKQANCDGNYPYEKKKGPYLRRPSEVGSYAANPFGLHDQHGNVTEWCQDFYNKDWYARSSIDDPFCPAYGHMRGLGGRSFYDHASRGGCFDFGAGKCRSSARCYPPLYAHHLGFRMLCEL